MRIVIIGGSRLGLYTAKSLIENGHLVTIIERDRDRLEAISEQLDCGFLHGDGSSPTLLREADPANSDIIYCLTNHDQTNIIAGLAARNLGYRQVVALVQDDSYKPLCDELGLDDIINPTQSISQRLVARVALPVTAALEESIKFDASLYRTVMTDSHGLCELPMPDGAELVGYYRDEKLAFPEADTMLQAGDELIILTRLSALKQLDRLFAEKESS
jgi:trk system potassium uptake protein TrkA